MSQPSDPESELEAILREIAADSDAKLLRVPAAASVMGLTKEEPVRASASTLTLAERHLLQVHREELRELLFQRCLIELYTAPGADLLWHKSVTRDQQLEIPAEEPWREHTKDVLSFGLGEGEQARLAEDVLAQCVRGHGSRPVTITQLALASLRVAPTDKARIHVAMDLLKDGRLPESRRVYEGVLAGRTKPLYAAYCWEGTALVLCREGKLRDAAVLYRKSYEVSARPIPLLSLFTVSVLLGDRPEADGVASMIEGQLEATHAAVSWFVRALRDRIEHSDIVLDRAAKKCADSLKDSVGRTAQEVLDALR